MKRTPLRRRGKGAERWGETRQSFLKSLFSLNATHDKQDEVTVQSMAPHSRRVIRIVRTGMGYVTDGHLHHRVARSRRPDLVHAFTNLALITADEHLKYDSDKGGDRWRADEAGG